MFRSKSNTGLIAAVQKKIMDEVIVPGSTMGDGGQKNFRVLVVDRLSTKLISSCCKMHDIYDHGITLVEDLLKLRESIVELEAIYLITPIKESIDILIKDFSDKTNPTYKAAYVYFTQTCPSELFKDLCNSMAAKKIKTLKEINVSFIPYERQAFTLDYSDTFQCFYDPSQKKYSVPKLEFMAQQITTVCEVLGEYPSVRYRKDCSSGRAKELAQIIKQKLSSCKADNPKLGEGLEKSRSQLIVIDRGFDCVSPIMHELTYQAMVYDNVKIENYNTYKYIATEDNTNKEAILDENDELWVKLRHEHISKVTEDITTNLKAFVDFNRLVGVKGRKLSIQQMYYIINKMTQHKKQLCKYSTHLNLAQNCLNIYTSYVNKLCNVEQDVVMGTDSKGIKIKYYLKNIINILLDQQVCSHDKMRIIILYIWSKNGISEDYLNKLIVHAQLSLFDKRTIANLNLLGINVITTPNPDVLQNNKKKHYEIPRKNRITDSTCHLSRWTPVIKDVMEDCIEQKLDSEHFPFLTTRSISNQRQTPRSVRFRSCHNNNNIQHLDKSVSRIIIFIIGGMTFSEMRSAYEVTKNSKNWEVIIGSSCVLTPKDFLNKLSSLNQ